MGISTAFSVGVLSFATLIAGALPCLARPATVTTHANLRMGASLTTEVLEVLSPNAPVEVLNIAVGDDGNYWYYVRPEVEGSPEGWMSSTVVRFQASEKQYATLAGNRGDRINVRSGPNINRHILHYGLVGDLVTVEESYKEFMDYRWYRVTFPNDASGWVRGDLLSIWPEGCIVTCPEY